MATISKDNIIYGGPENPGITGKFKNFAEFTIAQLDEIGNKTILIDGFTGEELTAIDIKSKIIRFAYCLKKLGIKENDVVGICSENCVEFLITLFATFCLNATVAPLNITYTERELNHAINLSKPKIFFTSIIAAEKVAKVTKKNSFVKHVFVFGNKSPVKTIQTTSKLINDSRIKSSDSFEFEKVDKNANVALIVCSSGTTGLPKGVQLTQRNITSTIDREFETRLILQEATILSVIPWFHSFGCLTLIITTCMGTRFVFLPKFEEHLFLNSIQKYQVQMAFMVPPLMVFLAKHPMIDNYDLSSLQMLLCGAAPLSKETEDAIKERIGVPFIRQGYGLSESTLSLLVQSDVYCKPGSVGGLKAGIYCKVINPETGESLGPYQRGELCFKGGCIMKGYIGDIEATNTVIDKDGWFHTGDIGYYDDDFEFFIVDRIKELIKYKAFQVPPAEIEALLLTHPKIRDAAVVGLPDEVCGELPFAFVVKQPNVVLTEQEVYNFVAENASPAKKLRGGVQFVDEIPKNPSGKILRRVLRDMLTKKVNLKSKL